LAAGRTQHTDSPLAVTVTDMPFAQKLVITTEAISAAFTGAAVTAGSGATACVEDDTIAGTYWCTVPSNQDTGSNDIAITKDGFVKHVTGDTVDRTDAGKTQGTVTIDDVKYAHKVTVTDELGTMLTSGMTVTTGGSYGTTCVQSGTTNTFYCPVPLSDTDIAIKVEKDGYVTHTADSFAEDRDSETDAQGTKAVTTVRYAVKVSVDDAAAENNAVTGATVRTGDSLGVTCVEPGAPDSTYYCAVPLAHTATDVELAKDGYVTKSFASAWTDRTHAADAQLTVTGADLQHGFRLTVSNYTGTPLTENLTVSSGDGFGVTCDQDGSTNVFHCPIPLAHTGVRIKVVQNGEIVDKLHRFAVDRTAANDTQGFKAVVAGLVWYRVDVREEVGTLLPAATVSTGDSWGVVCSEPDMPNGTYYCPLAVNETNTDLRVQRSGYVTTVYTKALGNGTAPEAEWGEFNATGVKYTVRMVLHDTLNTTVSLNGTADKSEVAAVSGTPAIRYNNGHAYIAATGNDTYRITQAGYLTTT
ncbi:MAG: hypothetical protein QF415_17535, partial [Candidatus Undinarchaeales archaeon]|nr:hypothetical protein [Candidatus Undinarchaeales archaeon]